MTRYGLPEASDLEQGRSASWSSLWYWVFLRSSLGQKICSYLAEGTEDDFPECRIKLFPGHVGPLKANSNNNYTFPEAFNIKISSINTWDWIIMASLSRQTQDRFVNCRLLLQLLAWSGSWAHIYILHIPEYRIHSTSHTTHTTAYEKNTHWLTLGMQKDIAIVGVGFSSHTTPQVFCVTFTYRTQGSM